MYSRDVPKIVDYLGDKGPDGFLDIASFVLCTIQTPLSRVGDQMKDVKQNGVNATALWGHKRKGYQVLSENRVSLYHTLRDAESLAERLKTLVAIPGLGAAKGAFLLQLMGYNIGCLDSHNLKRFGLDRRVTIITKKNTIDCYINTVQTIGDAEFWWNGWCSYVAGNRMNRKLPTADVVSAYHYESIVQ